MDPADQKQEQERYWAGARRSRTRDLYRLTPLRRARRSVDAVLRRLLYGLLRLLFRPASFEGPIDVMALESLLIMPYGDALGDLVVASPVWRAIKRCHSTPLILPAVHHLLRERLGLPPLAPFDQPLSSTVHPESTLG